ncbi:MAG: type II toxin-antitoxin system RelE/ParE family toxin [Sulfitobacter sp.]
MPVLEWKATAVADLLAIIDYISDDNPAAAQALKNEIKSTARQGGRHENASRHHRRWAIGPIAVSTSA